MEPLKITAFLQTGQVVSSDGYLPLDSILAAEWIKRNYPEHFYNDGMKTGQMIEAELPLKKIENDGHWFWACSFAQYEQKGELIAHWHKRFDDQLAEQYVDFGKRRGKVDVKSGKYKNYRVPIVVLLAEKLEWYCVGDKEKIEELLNGIFAIGKKRSQGYGLIDEWQIETWHEDWSIYNDQGKLMRAIPSKNGNMVAGIRPPYWHTPNQVLCEVP